MDWAGLTSLDKMRAASTETIYTVGSLYTAVTGKRTRMTGAPIVDGYVSLRSFDAAATNNTLANVPYMIGYTLNDMNNMSAGIAAFGLNRENVGGKAYAYEFARPLPTDGRSAVQVIMANRSYDPPQVTVKVGDTVTWVNQDTPKHDVVADNGEFKSNLFDKGGTFSFTLTKTGTYPYHCSIHPGMVGTVVVQ